MTPQKQLVDLKKKGVTAIRSVVVYLSKVTGMVGRSRVSSKAPLQMRAHWTMAAASRKLKPTALNPYFRRNVIRNPNPMKIIT